MKNISPTYSLILLYTLLLSINVVADEPLRVGAIQSTSGIASEDGKTVIEALSLAQETLKQRDISIQIFIEDDQTNPTHTVTAYKRLTSKKVDAIIASTWDFTTNTLMSEVARDKLVLFNTSTLPESLHRNKADGFVFTNALSTYSEAAPFNAFIKKNKTQSLIVIYANNSWGQTQRNIYIQIAKKAGVSILGEHSSVSFDQNDWRNVLPTIKAQNPELVLLLLNKNDLEIFLRRAKEIHFSPRYFASKNAYDALSSSKNRALYNELCFTYPYNQLRKSKEFFRKYKARFGHEPRIYADNTYDALLLLAEAKKIAQREEVSFRDALQQVKMTGLLGPYEFSLDRSFSRGTSSLMCVVDSEVKVATP